MNKHQDPNIDNMTKNRTENINRKGIKAEDANKRKMKKNDVVIGFILLLLLTLAGGLLYYLLDLKPGQNEQEVSVSRDLSAGLLPGSNSSDYDANGEESIRIQINSRPVFESGESEGNLYIGNPDKNQFDMEVIIVLETEEIVYNSGIIPPGYYIANDKLDIVLKQGEHEALATITYYTGEEVVQSQTNVKLNLIINN